MFGSNFILSEIFISEWTLSLNRLSRQYKLDSLEVIGPIVAHLSSKFLSLQLDNFLIFALCLCTLYCILHATNIFFTLQSIHTFTFTRAGVRNMDTSLVVPGALDHSLQFIMDCNDAKANLDPKKDNFFAVTWVLLIHFAKRIVGFAEHIYKR